VTTLRLGFLTDLHRCLEKGARGSWHNEYDFDGLADRIGRALTWLDDERVTLLVLGGDLTHHADSAAMRAALELCGSGSQDSVLAVSGNHDVAGGVDLLVREVERIGNPRLRLAAPGGELIGGVRVAGMHLELGSGWFRSRLREGPPVDLWGAEPVVLVSHLPLLSHAATLAARGMPYPGDLLDREPAVASLLRREAPTIVISGHIHARDVHAAGPVLQMTQGALVEPPFDAALIEIRVDAGDVAVTRRTLRTEARAAELEPTLVGPIGSWLFSNATWTTTALDDSARNHSMARA